MGSFRPGFSEWAKCLSPYGADAPKVTAALARAPPPGAESPGLLHAIPIATAARRLTLHPPSYPDATVKTPLALAALALVILTAPAAAQAPVADAFRAAAKESGTNLVAAAEEMPADKYGFKPTPAQMSFGDIVGHLSKGNDFLCGKIAGATPPKRAELDKTASKDAMVARLKETFQYCESALAKLDDSKLTERMSLFGPKQFSRAETLFITAQDWADHYSQAAIYLRLNGLLPPTAKKKA
jgi:uncharacterized damage-inducible protein DinB